MGIVVLVARVLVLTLLAIGCGSSSPVSAARRTYVQQPSPTAAGTSAAAKSASFLAASVTFVSPTEGWVLGTRRCSATPCTALLHTRDGGATWGPAAASRASLSDVSKVRFANGRDGLAFGGGGLWSTHDDAVSWRRVPSVAGIAPYTLQDLVATPAGLYALVSGVDPQYGGGDGHVRVVVGRVSADDFGVVADLGPNANPISLVAAGNDADLLVSQTVVRATPTGITRSSVPDVACWSLAASSATDLLLGCGQGVAQGSMGSRWLYGSVDSGRHWTRLPDPGAGAGYDTEGFAATVNGHAMIGTVSGGGSGLLVTTDYARTWTERLTFPSDGAAGFGDLGYENSVDGVVIHGPGYAQVSQEQQDPLGYGSSGGALYRTHDGGRSWQRVTFP